MHVAVIAKPEAMATGVGRYTGMLIEELRRAGVAITRVAPSVPPLAEAYYDALRRRGLDVRTFLSNFPISVTYPMADVYHFSSQNLCTVLLLKRPVGRVVVTVHDILPYMLRHHPNFCSYQTIADRILDRIALMSLKRADAIFAVSHYTKQCLVDFLGIKPERIHVIHSGIDHTQFQPRSVPDDLYQRYGLPRNRRFMIYVGSEDPRKNVAMLLHALAMLGRDRPDVALLKVGRAHFNHERERLLGLSGELGVRSSIWFLDDVPDADLPLLYNLADIAVMPSLYEGFGFPALEAAACGTPVVYANSTSLPELMADAGLVFDPLPDGGNALAGCLARLFDEPQLRDHLRLQGLARASSFRWSRTAQQVRDQYQALTFQEHHGTPQQRHGDT